MKLKSLFITTSLVLLGMIAHAQDYTVNGMVKDAKTNDPVIGAAVYVLGTDIGTATDTEGFFSLKLERKRVKLNIAFIGYVDTLLKLKLKGDTALTVFIRSDTDIEEVEVEDDSLNWVSEDYKIHGEIKDIPADLSEKEELITEEDKVILPVVIENKMNISDIYLRNGEGSNQNLVYLDGAAVYKSKKLFDFIPFIKDENAESYNYYFGNYPARFGKHMTSILDVEVNEGRFDSYSGSIDLDFMHGGFTLEGPIMEDQSSFFIAGRKTYLNSGYTELFRNDHSDENAYWVQPGFYDLHAKYTHQLTEADKLSFHYYMSSNNFETDLVEADSEIDEYSFSNNISENYRNIVSSVNYVHSFREDLKFGASLHLTNYGLKQNIKGDSTGLINSDLSFVNKYSSEYKSGNTDLGFNMDLHWNPNGNHIVKFGAQFIYHSFNPVKAELSILDFENEFELDTSWTADKLNASQFILFAEDQIFIGSNLILHGGIHFSTFSNNGTSYYSLQPRLYAEYKLFDNLSLHASYAHYKQYIHFISNYSVGLGSDVFLPSDEEMKPANSHRFGGGIDILLPYDIEIKADAFYDFSTNVYTYKNDLGFFDSEEQLYLAGTNLIDRLERGRSDSYGIRVLFKKNIDNLRLAAGHTITNSSRTFDPVNFGDTYQYRYNNRHDFTLSGKYIFSDHFYVYLNWVFRSGQYITPIKQTYIPYNIETQAIGSVTETDNTILLEDDSYTDLGFRNDYQLPAVHRLDIGAEYYFENHSIGFKIYNVYNRMNPDYVDFKNSAISSSSVDQLVTYTMMPFFPTLSYSYRF